MHYLWVLWLHSAAKLRIIGKKEDLSTNEEDLSTDEDESIALAWKMWVFNFFVGVQMWVEPFKKNASVTPHPAALPLLFLVTAKLMQFSVSIQITQV